MKTTVKNLPFVTVEQVVAFRKTALAIEAERDFYKDKAVDFMAALRNCKNSSEGVMNQYESELKECGL